MATLRGRKEKLMTAPVRV